MKATGCTISQFRQGAASMMQDAQLRAALQGATGNFVQARKSVLAQLPDVEELRDYLKQVREATIANLAHYLEQFERNAQAAGAQVHWARDGAEAAGIVIQLALDNGVKMVAKSKSMATEEIHLNQALLAQGVQPVETDLGEWIIQLAEESPYHIIAPAIHKTKEQVVALFEKESGSPLPDTAIPALTNAARNMLREKFLAADMGISGANMGVAETGSIVLVTNEGNGRMVTSLPRLHVAVMGIEKIAPDWDGAAAWLSLLARSATGQPLSIYTTAITGPARADDLDGPEEVHIILLDNGRSSLLGSAYEEVLQCLRCGACLNICPVYRESGGHAYNSPYSGPIGAVITPLLFGLDNYPALPHASTLCGACQDVCPVRIDLPRMLLELRADEVTQGLASPIEALAEGAVAAVMSRPQLFQLAGKMAHWGQRPFINNDRFQPPINPTLERDLPVLPKKSFREMWRESEGFD